MIGWHGLGVAVRMMDVRNPVMAKAAATGHSTDWDRDAALTTARILLEIQAINFRP
jgi:hypothetical protein